MKEKQTENKEELTPQLGVYEETDPLRKVMMWGAPGAETILGQLLPIRVSRFEEAFNVIKARVELEAAASLLGTSGVEIYYVKDHWAEMIRENGLVAEKNLELLKKELRNRGEHFYHRYKEERDLYYNEEEDAGLEVLDLLDTVLDADVEKYGENAAVIMNQKLSLDGYYSEQEDENLPLSNIFYTRDQSNLIGNTWVWSSMRHYIRKAEVDIYKEVIRHSGILKGSNITEIEVQETSDNIGLFEGGDAIVNSGIAYIGAGGRTDWEGVNQIADPILKSGLRLIVLRDRERSRQEKDEQGAMHLDTFWMPIRENEAVGCTDEMDRRIAFEISLDEDGGCEIKKLGTFTEHIKDRGAEMIPLTPYEQLHHASNSLNIGNDMVILSLAKGNNLTKELSNRGIEVNNANLHEVTKGKGGLHCATASIARSQ